MSEEATQVSEVAPHGARSNTFERMSYWVSTDREAFDVELFRSRLPESVRASDDDSVAAAPKDEQNGEYNVRLYWKITEADIRLRLDYHWGATTHGINETEPFAEDFMRWLGQFFHSKNVPFHIHAYFEHLLSELQSTFPMKMATDLPGGATLTGVSLTMPSGFAGASSVKITRGRSRWYTEVVSDREVTLADSTPTGEAALSRSALSVFLKEVRS